MSTSRIYVNTALFEAVLKFLSVVIAYETKFEVFDYLYGGNIVIPSPEGNYGKKYQMNNALHLL